MRADRHRWNCKYADHDAPGAPSSLLTAYSSQAPGPKALDLAAGLGRNTVFLLQQGFQVVATDISDKAVKTLAALNHPNLLPVQADLDTFVLPAATFDLIVNCNFLDRRLIPALQEGLTPYGLLIFESFVLSPAPNLRQPHNPDYLLRPNELIHLFWSLHIQSYAEGLAATSDDSSCIASLVAKKIP